MIHLLILFILTGQHTLTVDDTAGLPVIGASVCCDSTLLGFTDAGGEVNIAGQPDVIEVRALGYSLWSGSYPESGHIQLVPVPVPSGTVISVRASRRGFRDGFPATTVLGKDDMEFLSITGLGGLSSRTGGAYVRQYGGAMTVISVSMRGSDAAHTGYFVDGHEIASSMDNRPGIEIDPSMFGGMEVSRGGGSGYLRGGMAGVLNFLPESRNSPANISLRWWDNGSSGISGGVPVGIGRFTLSLRRTVGIHGSRANHGSVLYIGAEEGLRYGLLTSASGGGTESPDWTVPTDGRRERYSADGWLRWMTGRFMFSADARTGRHSYASTLPTIIDDTHDELQGSGGIEYHQQLGVFDIDLAGEFDYQEVWSSALGNRNRISEDIATSAGYRSAVSLSLSTRISLASSEEPGWGMRLSAGLPVSDSLISFHTTISRGFRRPSFNDLYWPEDNFAIGNPDLKPESSVEVEAGVSLLGLDFLRLSATGFSARTEDMIRWAPGEGGKWSPVNIAIAHRRGIETEAWFSMGSLELTGGLMLLRVTDDCPESSGYGKVLPYTPDYTWGIRSDLVYPSGYRWWVQCSGMGIRFKNYSETSWMPAYTTVSAGVTLPVPFTDSFSFGLTVENVLDEEYEETNGYTGKPRTISLQVRWNSY